jgi:phosphatidylglycerophosphatase A
MKDKIIKAIATFFGVGYIPFMPGTWGSLAGALIYLVARHNICLSWAIFLLLVGLGLYAAGRAEVLFGKKDDKRIVIDEVCGVFFIYLLIPSNIYYLATGFILYRIFDILKPYPAKKMEHISGSVGVIMDDIIAALYSFVAITLFLMLRHR